MSTLIFTLILVFYTALFITSRVLSFLNLSYADHPLPSEISDLYDPDKRQQQLAYQKVNTKFGTINSAINFIIMLLMLSLGGFAWLDTLVQSWTANPILQALCFFGILLVAQEILDLPMAVYDTFVIEQRFGFNRTTPKTFIADTIKSLLLNLVLYGIILSLMVWIYTAIPQWFWLIAWAVMTFFSLILSQFYSNLIVPLFNKQTPLPEGELRTAIEQFAASVNFKIDNIYVMDSSKRSTKANAYFTGWGRHKRIVLYDTLIDTLSTDEIVAVLAHEIGHNQHHHTLKSILMSMVQNLIVFALLGVILRYDVFAQAIGCQAASFHINILVFTLLFEPVSFLVSLLGNALSRRHEYQADHFVKTHNYAQHLITALKKITADSLGNPIPHPAVVFCKYSHPTLYQRIKALQ